MEYQKIINLFDNTSKQPFQFKTKNWMENNYGIFSEEYLTQIIKVDIKPQC